MILFTYNQLCPPQRFSQKSYKYVTLEVEQCYKGGWNWRMVCSYDPEAGIKKPLLLPSHKTHTHKLTHTHTYIHAATCSTFDVLADQSYWSAPVIDYGGWKVSVTVLTFKWWIMYSWGENLCSVVHAQQSVFFRLKRALCDSSRPFLWLQQ